MTAINWLDPTLSDEVLSYVQAVTDAVRDVFRDATGGVWALGSLAYGGFGPTSDVDLQAAVSCVPSHTQIERLVDRIDPDRLLCPAAGIEFVLYDAAVLENPVPPLQWSLNLNGGPTRERKVSTDPTSEAWHWFVLDLAIGRETAVTLYGQDLADVLGPISRATQLAAISASLDWHDAYDNPSPNRVANAARGLRFAETGTWGSKQAAVEWLGAAGYSPNDAVDLARARVSVRG